MSDLAAGYYRYLAQAVGALAQHTPEARAGLYQQVRGAVAHRLDTAQPPHPDAEIARHKTALEVAIRLVELSAGYRPSLTKAIVALAPNTPEARAALYQRGRTSLERRLRAAQPPRSDADIAVHRAALEEAIRGVEAEHSVPSGDDGGASMGTARQQPVRSHPAAPVAPSTEPREGGFRLPVGLLLIVLIGAGLASGALIDAQGDLALFEVAARYGWIGLWVALLAYAVYVVVRRRRRLRDSGIKRHRVAALAVNPGGSDGRRQTRLRLYQEAVQNLNDGDLLWAYWLPEHADQAKKVALVELERRGHPADQVRRWSPPASQLTVPPTAERPVSVNKYSRLVLMRRGGWILFQVLSLTGLAMFAGVVIGGNIDPALGVSGVAAMIGLMLLLVAFGVAFLVQDRARRILLLRPFGEKKMTSTLRRFVRKNVGLAGYAFTLSDRNYKPSFVDSLLFRILSGGFETLVQFAVGSIFANSHRIAAVNNDKSFFRLASALTQKFTLSYWSFITSGQAFNIRTTDPYWQVCIQMLMHSCDVVIVDLSRVKAGTAWEINELYKRDLRARCMFVVSEDHQGEVSEVLAQHFSQHGAPLVYVYQRNGRLLDKQQFSAELKQRLELALVQA
jgi:hypothetical protein